MAFWRYKCVAAPRRARASREHRTPAEALVAAMQAAIAAEAAQGWEYLRTDIVPMEASRGLFAPRSESHQAVLVFRRPAAPVADQDDAPAPPRPRRLEAQAEIPRLGAARLD